MAVRPDPRTDKLQKQLNNRIPLIGSWLRLDAARLLCQAANQGSPQAARILALALISSPDGQVRRLASSTLSSLERHHCVDAIWVAWLDTRSPILLKILLQKNWVANAPPRARVFSALRLERLELITRSGAEVIEPLVEALGDPNLSTGARECLLHLESSECVDALASLWVKRRQPETEEILLEAGYLASQPPAVRIMTALLNNRTEILNTATAEMISGLLDACRDQNPQIKKSARISLGELLNPAAIEALCSAWSAGRQEWLVEIIKKAGYLPNAPGPVRVLVALKVNQNEVLEELSPEEIPALLHAAEDGDRSIAGRVPEALRSIKHQASLDALCQAAASEEHPLAVRICLENDFQPQAPEARALFFFMTEQWSRYTALDFDQRLLRAIFETASPGLRARITRKLRRAGRTDFLTVLAGSDYRARATSMDESETEVLVHLLMQNHEHRRLWELALELSVGWSVEILRHLGQEGFQPGDEYDQPVFSRLLDLAHEAEPGALDHLPAVLPPAYPRARVFVSGRVNDIAFDPGSRQVALATGNRKVVLWDYHTAEIVDIIAGFSHSVGRVAYTSTGELICAERTVSTQPCGVYSWRDGSLQRLGEHTGSVTTLQSAGERRALSAGKDGRVVLWDTTIGRPVSTKDIHFWPRAARVSTDHSQVLLLDQGIALLSLPELEHCAGASRSSQYSGYHSTSISRSATFLPEVGKILVGKANGQALVYTQDQKKFRPDRSPLLSMGAEIQAVESIPEHHLVLLASARGEIQYVSWPSRKTLSLARIPGDRLTSLKLSPDRSFMASGDSDASMSLWDLRVLDLPTLIRTPMAAFTFPDISGVHASAKNEDIQGPLLIYAQYMDAALLHRNRFDIGLEDTPTIRAGEFDIVIEDPPHSSGATQEMETV